MTDEEQVNQRLNEVAESLTAMQLPSNTSDMERLLSTGERLLRRQQDKLVAVKANYEAERTSVINTYAEGLANLERNTADKLHQLLQERDASVSEIERLITKLKALREA